MNAITKIGGYQIQLYFLFLPSPSIFIELNCAGYQIHVFSSFIYLFLNLFILYYYSFFFLLFFNYYSSSDHW